MADDKEILDELVKNYEKSLDDLDVLEGHMSRHPRWDEWNQIMDRRQAIWKEIDKLPEGPGGEVIPSPKFDKLLAENDALMKQSNDLYDLMEGAAKKEVKNAAAKEARAGFKPIAGGKFNPRGFFGVDALLEPFFGLAQSVPEGQQILSEMGIGKPPEYEKGTLPDQPVSKDLLWREGDDRSVSDLMWRGGDRQVQELGLDDPTARLGGLDRFFDTVGKSALTGGTEAENRAVAAERFPGLDPRVRDYTGHHVIGSEFGANRYGSPLADLGGIGTEMIESAFYGTNSTPQGQIDTALDLVANDYGRKLARGEMTEAEVTEGLNRFMRQMQSGEIDPRAVQREINPIGSRLINAVTMPEVQKRAQLENARKGRAEGVGDQLLRMFSGGGVTSESTQENPFPSIARRLRVP